MRRISSIGAPGAALACFVLAACGGGGSDSPDDIRAELSEQFQEQVGLEPEQADCFADVMIEEIGADELADVDFSAEEPEDLQDEFAAAAVLAIETCDINAEALSG